MKIEKRYHIYEHDDRVNVLCIPMDSYGHSIFNIYGYDSEEEAIEHIAARYRTYSPMFFIIPSIKITEGE